MGVVAYTLNQCGPVGFEAREWQDMQAGEWQFGAPPPPPANINESLVLGLVDFLGTLIVSGILALLALCMDFKKVSALKLTHDFE